MISVCCLDCECCLCCFRLVVMLGWLTHALGCCLRQVCLAASLVGLRFDCLLFVSVVCVFALLRLVMLYLFGFVVWRMFPVV